MTTVHRSGAILIKDRKVLVERSWGKNFFIPPGGQLETGETPKQALIRELFEELKITVVESEIKKMDTFYIKGGGQENYDVQMDMFYVNYWQGEITSDNEVEEILWIDSRLPMDVKIGSIFEHEVLPRLKEQNLID